MNSNLVLDPFQQQAIASIEAGASVLVSAPTGSGKTLIAEEAIKQAMREGREVIYTA
ncbi:MAG: DEAD/DEAH box helicase, partial [Candidatus Omnitrophica bacterium]|nr:DEAD/DEAH box helicase [Candidatus Omnitrophota bacterium]